MQQLVYISSIRRHATMEAETVLAQSRRNNARVGVTGLLYFDGKRFLQALEGESAAVQATFNRIRADERHYAIVILSDRTIDTREFGEWAMAYGAPGETDTAVLGRVASLTANADPSVRATFEGFAKVRRTA